ncbi:MAG: 16S rRNA (cytidine(1402)-2'-O)-methyltransferase [Gammaproteobacteria bacterium GWF2_41_13]|nr:MAG: 16S rRNA (cytidine(1402)-2'-O)-methyltransferase [Gammaproteobacteria bacterium GWF2_41_13]
MSTLRGKLYIVATPLGHLDDMSFRAIKTLQSVDFIAAEDTRHSAKLLTHYQISTPMISLHDYNEQERHEKIITLIQSGHSVALISDAGTPLISDPGYRLVHAAKKLAIDAIPIPGPCAAIAALSVSGLPTDCFIFEGFLSAKSSARLAQLNVLKHETRTMIFYESPHRILACLDDMQTIFGQDREVVVARELTKFFETIYSDSVENILKKLRQNPSEQQGEFVVLVKGAVIEARVMDEETTRVLNCLLAELPIKQAVKLTAEISKKSKNLLYDLALILQKAPK